MHLRGVALSRLTRGLSGIIALGVATAQARVATTEFRAVGVDGRSLVGTLELTSTRVLVRASPSHATALDFATLKRLIPADVIDPPAIDVPTDIRVGLPVTEIKVTGSPDQFSLHGESGEMEGTGESMRLWGWRGAGERALTAHLMSVTTQGAPGHAVGGIMVRQDDGGQTPFVAVALNSTGACHVLFRRDTFQFPESFPLAQRGGGYFRITREERRTRVQTSADGKIWHEAWSMPLPVRINGVAGAFVSCRVGQATLEAQALHFTPAAPPPAVRQGVMLVDGNFISCNVTELVNGQLQSQHPQHDFKLDRARVAWFSTGPLSALELERLASTGEGVLLKNDDVLTGRLTSFRNDRATVDTLLFGEHELHPAGGGWTAVMLNLTGPPNPAQFRIRFNTGDVLLGDGLSVIGDKVRVDVAGLPDDARTFPLDQLEEVIRR